MNGIWDRKMPCEKTYFPNYHQVEVTRTLSQQWTYFPYTFLHTQSLPPTEVGAMKIISDIITRHAYQPTLMITDKGSLFILQVIGEVATVLGMTLNHATTNHAQTIGVLERTHATCNNENLPEYGIRLTPKTIARIPNISLVKLSHDLPHESEM